MLTGIGAWLRKQREARGWARREMAHRLTQAAQAVGDTTVPGIENLCTYIRRWEYGRHGPTERYVLYYCTAFGLSADEFGTAPTPPPPKPKPEIRAVERSAGTLAVDAAIAASIAAAYRNYQDGVGVSGRDRPSAVAGPVAPAARQRRVRAGLVS